MGPFSITAATAVSALGRGRTATLAALRERRSGLAPCDFAGVRRGHVGLVKELEGQQLPPEFASYDCRNNRLAYLTLHTDEFGPIVAEAAERHGPGRIAVVLGTSTSGVLSTEEAYCWRDPVSGALPVGFDYAHTHDLFALPRFVRAALGLSGPALAISNACASSARSFIDGAQLIEAGICDAAVVGGVDTLCRLTLRGFASLQLISEAPCRPCDARRSGISLGEAGGFALLERVDRRTSGNRGSMLLLGFGTTSDGYHMSSPDPRGAGAIGAMRQALAVASLDGEQIDYVNLHGTGTRANDAMEDAAVTGVFGPAMACSSTKGWSGHTLGASGILEALIASLVLSEGLIPGCLGVEEVDPSFRARVLIGNEERPVRRVMSNAFGFGGVNCSLVFGSAA